MAAMTSPHIEKCCRLVNAHAASARRIYAAASSCSWPVVVHS